MTIDPPAPRTVPGRRARRARNDWRIDPLTRRTGLAGLARARAALEATRTTAKRADQPDAA